MKTNKFLYNPFEYIAGYKALFIGSVGLAFTSLLTFFTGTHFNGVLNIDFAKDCDYWVYLIENLLYFLILTTLLYLYTKLFTTTKVRLVDVAGMILVARIPLIIAPLFRLHPFFDSFVINSLAMYLIVVVYLTSLIWTIILLYHAFRVSCNLKDSKLTTTLIVTLLLTEVLTKTSLYLIL